MRRAVFVPILLLALGLCSSFLVAWAGALLDRSAWPDTLLTGVPVGTRTEMRGWLVEEGRDRTLTWRTFKPLDLWDEPPDLEAPTRLPAWSVGHGLPDQPGPFAPARERTFDRAWEVSAGWPARCVRAVRRAGPTEFALPGEFARGGLAAMAYAWPAPHDAVAGHERIVLAPWPVDGLAAVVPLRPMPIGLVLNTIVHALAWCVLLLPLIVLRPLRRRRRARKNRCVACGHARDGLPDGAPCAECGRDPKARTGPAELLTARAPVLGAALALFVVLGASAALLTQRWMAVDRLPPLHRAAAVGDVQEIERLLAAGAAADDPLGDVNSAHGFLHQSTALHWAASRRHLGASRALLDGGADPAVDVFGYQPVVLAIGTGDPAIAGLLMSALRPGDELVAIDDVFGHAHPSIQRELLDRVITTERAKLELAARAVLDQDLVLLDALVDGGLRSGGRQWYSVLGRAVIVDGAAYERPYGEDLGLTRHVLGLGLTIRPDVAELAVRGAMRSGCVPALEALLAAYPRHKVAARGLSGDELAGAAMRGGAPAIARLVGLGADPDAPASQGFNALLPAAMEPDAEAVAILLDAGADPTHAEGGTTLRRWLLDGAERAAKDRGSNPHFPSLADPDAFARILDLLEAAEARWRAGEGGADAAETPGGP
ncbi:hypothetical protein AY599_17345 [Leptolyngbya valderiana BDU 20041]|nr:hypothetical protein AY599_17345 [Leptolyngbya valderiana BDU 20041]